MINIDTVRLPQPARSRICDSVAFSGMDADGFAAIAAWVAVPAAYLSARYGWSQARSADRSRIADERAGWSAHDSAKSDRESVALARAALAREDAPTFEMTLQQGDDGSFGVIVKLLSGPPELLIEATWFTESSWPSGERARTGRMFYGQAHGTFRIVRTESFGFRVDTDDQADQNKVTVNLYCRDADDESREWRFPQVLEWDGRPPNLW